jgi:predicted negative regulator of RcsB-dependent stress response
MFVKKMFLQKLCLAAVIIFLASKSLAHGDILHRIEALDKKLTERPNDPVLLIERGRLYLDAHQPQDAKRDLDQALKLTPDDALAHYYLAQANLEAKKNNEALIALDFFLQHEDQEAPRTRGLALRGDIYRASGKPKEAAIAYAESLALKKLDALPDDYVRLADTYLQINTQLETKAPRETKTLLDARKNNIEKALAVLDQGILQLGSLHTLVQRAITIELESNQPQSALKRLDQLITQNKATPYLLLQKGKILKNINELQQATETFQTALILIEQMPQARRNTQAMQTLGEDIVAQMNVVEQMNTAKK